MNSCKADTKQIQGIYIIRDMEMSKYMNKTKQIHEGKGPYTNTMRSQKAMKNWNSGSKPRRELGESYNEKLVLFQRL